MRPEQRYHSNDPEKNLMRRLSEKNVLSRSKQREMARTLCIALLLSLGGCMLPASVTYLSPEKTSGVSVTSSRRGPHEVVKLKGPADLEMTLIVFDLDDGTLIRFFFDLPEGRSFQMNGDHFRIKTEKSISSQEIAIEKINANEIRNNIGHQVSFTSLEKISGATYTIRETPVPQPVYVEVKSSARLPDEFEFVLPQLLIAENHLVLRLFALFDERGRSFKGRHHGKNAV